MSFPTILTSTEPEPKQCVFHGHTQNNSSNNKSAGSETSLGKDFMSFSRNSLFLTFAANCHTRR